MKCFPSLHKYSSEFLEINKIETKNDYFLKNYKEKENSHIWDILACLMISTYVVIVFYLLIEGTLMTINDD